MVSRKLLITGGNGFIGGHILRTTENLGYSVIAPSRYQLNIIDSFSVYEFFKEHDDITDIIHCAGIATPTSNPDDITNTCWNNVNGTANLLKHCKPHTNFLFLSSVTVYGNQISADEKMPTHATSPYGASKIGAESYIQACSFTKNIRYTILRVCATIGKHMTHGAICDFIKKAQNDNPEFPLLGIYPGSLKPYCYIDDVVRAITTILEHNIFPNEIFNISSVNNVSIDKVADIVLDYFKVKKTKVWTNENFLGDNRIIQVNCDKAKRYNPLYWTPQYSSEQAVIQTLKDYDNGLI